MSDQNKYLNKENVLEAISIGQLIANEGLIFKKLHKEEEPLAYEKYNSIIKPAIESYKSKYGSTPNLLLKKYLTDFLSELGYSETFEVKSYTYYSQIIRPYVSGHIRRKDELNNYGKREHYPFPQLLVAIDRLDIHFGFFYGWRVRENDPCVLRVKSDNTIKQHLIDLLKKHKDYQVFFSHDHLRYVDPPEIFLRSFSDIEEKWTNTIYILKVFKPEEVPDNIEAVIKEVLTNLFDFLVMTSHDDPVSPFGSGLVREPNPLYQSNNNSLLKELLSKKKQVILYGPPGTGKTWHAKNLLPKNGETSNRIEFVTFHPSFGYEEFIEGLRPNTDKNGSLTFHIHDGIFKQFAQRACNNLSLPLWLHPH